MLEESALGICTKHLVLHLVRQEQCVRHQRKMSTSSNKVETFEIEFDREPAVYREGDNITGKVNVTLNEEIKLRSKCYFALPCFFINKAPGDGIFFDLWNKKLRLYLVYLRTRRVDLCYQRVFQCCHRNFSWWKSLGNRIMELTVLELIPKTRVKHMDLLCCQCFFTKTESEK